VPSCAVARPAQQDPPQSRRVHDAARGNDGTLTRATMRAVVASVPVSDGRDRADSCRRCAGLPPCDETIVEAEAIESFGLCTGSRFRRGGFQSFNFFFYFGRQEGGRDWTVKTRGDLFDKAERSAPPDLAHPAPETGSVEASALG